MLKQTISILQPDIYDEFQCIGGKCRNSCCEYKWKIVIDKATYKKYKNIKGDKEFADKFQSAIKINKDKTGSVDYALIKQGQDDKERYRYKCPFLNDKGLCDIVCKYGPDYLSDTCQSYPRVCNRVGENIYINTIDCSCEEVLRIIGEKSTPIDLISIEDKISDNNLNKINNLLKCNIKSNKNILKDEYLYILMICLAIIQNREYTVDERLVHLGIYLNKLEEIAQSGILNELKSESEKVVYAIENHLFDSINKTDTNYQDQISLVMSLVNGIFNKGEFPDFILKVKENLGNTISLKLLKIHKERMNNLQAYMKEKDKDIFWENYLTLIMLTYMFPLNEENFIDSYKVLATQYVVAKTMLAEYMDNSDKISDEEMYDILAFYNKKVLHNKSIPKIIIKFLDENDVNDLPHILAIIKL